ncbi:hypothetical protein BDW74DRAFT_53315 [Aspergillus multicolor]|uniref:uncharacterized protein n=1 Tax=Aspergillus multicolor TaxID=41759 RepID=UPI003CCC8FA1
MQVQSMANPPVRRRRPAVACTECRRRKIRCDQATPCGHCEKGGLQCIYNHMLSNAGRSHPSPPATTVDNSPPFPMNQDLIQEPGIGSLDNDFALDSVNSAIPAGSSIFTEPNSVLPAVSQHLAWDFSPSNSDIGAMVDIPVGGFEGHMDMGGHTWVEILNCDPDKFWSDSEDLRRMWRETRDLEISLATSKTPLRSHHWSPDPVSLSKLIPPQAICDALLELYINTFESAIRILHIPSFYQNYRQYWNRPDSVSDVFLCQLLLAMTIGTVFVPASPTADRLAGMRSQALAWMHYSQQWVFRKLVLEGQLNVDILQVGCLLLLCRQASPIAIGDRNFWLSEDHLLRLAMKLGLHHDPQIHNPAMFGPDAEVRRRLWVTLLELSLQASLDAGLPAPLPSDGGFNTELPSNLTDADLGSIAALIDPKPRSVFTHSTVQILLAETQRIRLRILNLLYSPGTIIPYQQALDLAAELRRACNSNLRLLQSFTSQPSVSVTPTEFQIKILDLWTRRFLLALLTPYADESRSDYSFYYTRKGRVEASSLLLSYPLTNKAAKGHSSSGSNYYIQLQISGQGIFKKVLRQATSAICDDLMQELIEDAFPVTDQEPHSKLRRIIKDSISIYRRRLEQNQASMQEYVAFTCASTQIEALSTGWNDGNHDLLPIARKALEDCRLILETAQRSITPEQTFGDTSPMMNLDQGVNFWADLLSTPFVTPPSPPLSSPLL